MMSAVKQKRWTFIRRYLWRIGFIALAALIYSWIATHATTTTYKAETTIAFKSTELPVRFEFLKLFSNPLPIFLEDDVYSVTYDIPSILTSDLLTNRVIERGNYKEKLYNPKEYPVYQDWYDDFRAHLMFDIYPNTQSMKIAYAARTPELAKEITQYYSDEFEKIFVNMYWRYRVSDSIEKIVKEREDELANLDALIDDYLLAHDKIAVRRGVAQDIMDYLYSEKARIMSSAEIDGYELAIERLKKDEEAAKSGRKYNLMREALFDPVLVFAKGVYFQGQMRLTELEADYTDEYPETRMWKQLLPAIEGFVEDYSRGAIRTTINALYMRSLAAKARNEFWTGRANKLRAKIEGLPQLEEDIYWMLRKQQMLDVELWFWQRRLEFHKMGEDLVDDPFIVVDDPVVPYRAYYPILNTWVYAFPVLLIVGTLWFLMRYKLEEECIQDIVRKGV